MLTLFHAHHVAFVHYLANYCIPGSGCSDSGGMYTDLSTLNVGVETQHFRGNIKMSMLFLYCCFELAMKKAFSVANGRTILVKEDLALQYGYTYAEDAFTHYI